MILENIAQSTRIRIEKEKKEVPLEEVRFPCKKEIFVLKRNSQKTE